MTDPSPPDRVLGSMLGGALGDALGAPVEFLSLERIRAIHGPDGVTGLEEAYGRRGAITDDTQMALFTAEGLIRADNGWRDRGIGSPRHVLLRAYLRWKLTQGATIGEIAAVDDLSTGEPSGWLVGEKGLHSRRAPGNTCLGALAAPERAGLGGPAPNDSKGCGGVMRVAPVGFLAADPFGFGAETAMITHGHPTGYLAAGALAFLISRLAKGLALDRALDETEGALTGAGDEEVETLASLRRARELAAAGAPTPEKVESLGQGWVAEEALAIAVYGSLAAPTVRDGAALGRGGARRPRP